MKNVNGIEFVDSETEKILTQWVFDSENEESLKAYNYIMEEMPEDEVIKIGNVEYLVDTIQGVNANILSGNEFYRFRLKVK